MTRLCAHFQAYLLTNHALKRGVLLNSIGIELPSALLPRLSQVRKHEHDTGDAKQPVEAVVAQARPNNTSSELFSPTSQNEALSESPELFSPTPTSSTIPSKWPSPTPLSLNDPNANLCEYARLASTNRSYDVCSSVSAPPPDTPTQGNWQL